MVDPLFRLFPFADGNDYAQTTEATTPLIALARETGCAIVAVHHARKSGGEGGDETLGSTALFGACDTLISIKREGDAWTIETTQREGLDMPRTALLFDPMRMRLDLGTTRRETALADTRQAIMDYLTENCAKDWTRKDLIAGLKKDPTRVVPVLKAMIDKGTILQFGTGKRGDAYRVRIAR